MSFQLFIKMDLGGRGTITINNCTRGMTVEDFRQKVLDKEGAQAASVRLIYGGKQLEDGKTLGDYNLQNENTLMAVFRLLGGAEPAPVAEQKEPGKTYEMDAGKVRKLKDVMIGDQKVNITASRGECPLCLETKMTAVLHGSERVCAECMARETRGRIYNGHTFIKCTCSCNKEIPFNVAFTVCGLSDAEWKDWEFWLNKNALGFKICPNAQCGRFVFRTEKGLRVRCPSCKQHDFCWLCLDKWKGGGSSRECGNVNCTLAAEGFKRLQDSWNEKGNHPQKTISDYTEFPLLRVCPNPTCARLNEWEDNCKHMTCKSKSGCTHQYCHICLRKWHSCKCGYCQYIGDSAPTCSGSYTKNCELAPLQANW